MRILHIGKFFPPHHGGMEVFLADLIAEQQAQGLEVAAIVHGEPLQDDPTWLTRVPVQVQLIYAPIALGFRSALDRVIKTFKPDILHLHMPNTSVFWALTLASARSIPWVVHWQSDVVVSTISKALALTYRFYRPFEQAVLERAESIIVTSPAYLATSAPLQEWQHKCTVIPLGLAAQSAIPQGSNTDEAHDLWTPGCFRLLTIGRLTYYKDHETLIRVVAGQPRLELLIVGAGQLQSRLEALIKSLTPVGEPIRVKLLGGVSEKQKNSLLKSCDAFCLASCERTESFGMVLLEAMAHGKPCLVTDLQGSGMPWVVKEANAGLSVPLKNVNAWRNAIDLLNKNEAARLQFGRNGKAASETTFSISNCARSIQTAYQQNLPVVRIASEQKDVLIVIPAKDEALTIGAVVSDLIAAGWLNVLVVNDQSRDETAEIAANAGARVMQPLLPLGAWVAMQAGIRYGVANGYKSVITMDADGQHEVAELPALIKMSGHADVVIGAYPERASAARRLAWFWFRKLTGFELRDMTSGFRYYGASAITVLASEEATLLDYQDVGVLLLLKRAGMHIVEVDVSMKMRTNGKSRIFKSWFNVFKYMAMTTLLCLSSWRNVRV